MSKLAHSMDCAVYRRPDGRYVIGPDFSMEHAATRYGASEKIEGELLLTEAQDLASELGATTEPLTP